MVEKWPETVNCDDCNGTMIRGEKEGVPGWYCTSCDESEHTLDDIQNSDWFSLFKEK